MSAEMETIYRRCAGLDVHQKSIQACVRCLDDRGEFHNESRQFGAMTRDILALGDWLAEQGVTHVAMEATGVYWKPIWNLLDDRFELWLCNARAVKQVPGRKTDVSDAQWLAQLMQFGLLKPSFVPSRALRDLRDLTRQRVQLVNEHTRAANRIQKVLEDANIKLSSVVSEVLGVSGRRMLRALIDGETDPAKLAELAHSKLRGKLAELTLALQGGVKEHHRFLLRMHYDHLTHLEEAIAQFEARIDRLMQAEAPDPAAQDADALPFAQAAAIVDTMTGIDVCAAQAIVAEIGTDMSRFPDADHCASWAGLCSGNNESAGKRRSGKTPKGSRWLRRILCQAAWAAAKSKDTYLSALYRRLAARRGKKRAIVALAHTMLVCIYHMLKTRQPYVDLGPTYLDQLNPERLIARTIRRLEALGLNVEITVAQPAA